MWLANANHNLKTDDPERMSPAPDEGRPLPIAEKGMKTRRARTQTRRAARIAGGGTGQTNFVPRRADDRPPRRGAASGALCSGKNGGSMEAQLETALITHCAPTLAGMKPANLFRFRGESLEQARHLARRWDQRLKSRGVRVRVLKESPAINACMLYVYRPDWVKRLLGDGEKRAFLEGAGYEITGVTAALKQLSARLCPERDYPHEIGIFLGYPLEDVVGFIENRGRDYACCGCWKAYGDPEAARACFERYRRCTALYKERYARGIPLLQLVAAA